MLFRLALASASAGSMSERVSHVTLQMSMACLITCALTMEKDGSYDTLHSSVMRMVTNIALELTERMLKSVHSHGYKQWEAHDLVRHPSMYQMLHIVARKKRPIILYALFSLNVCRCLWRNSPICDSNCLRCFSLRTLLLALLLGEAL